MTKEPTKAEDAQEAVKAFLATDEGQNISVQKLKKEAGLKDVNSKTINRALTQALEKK